MRHIAGISDPKLCRSRRKSGAPGGFLCRIFRSGSRFCPGLVKLAFGAVHLLHQPLYLRGGAHLSIEPSGRIQRAPRRRRVTA